MDNCLDRLVSSSQVRSGDNTQQASHPPGTSALAITRRMLAGPSRDEPVEAAVNIIPANRVVLDYVIDLDTEPKQTSAYGGGMAPCSMAHSVAWSMMMPW